MTVLAAFLAAAALAQDAAGVHVRALTIDTHVDTPDNYASHEYDPGGFTTLQVDLPKMRAGGLDAAFFIVFTRQGDLTEEGYAAARENAETEYANIRRMIAAYPDQVALATTADEVRAIADSGRRVALIGIENAYPFGESVEDVAMWAERGVRYVGITHFGNNQFAGSSNPDPERGEAAIGLSDLGRALVAELNDYGIMIDVSHVGKQSMMEAVSLSRAPVLASHSGAKAVGDTARNLDDEQLRAIRDNGGVAHMVALDVYVKPLTEEQDAAREAIRADMGLETSEARSNADAETRAEYQRRVAAIWEIEPRATVADFVDHVDHAVEVAGVDHVGIASDFDGGGGIVGWTDASETQAVTEELLRRGYSEADIAKLWGGNILRVMRAVEEAAAQ